MKVSDQLQAPADLSPGKWLLVSIVQEVGWIQEPVWTLWSRDKSFAPAVNPTPVIQPVARRYTD
jgi:hypothetical protein